MRLCHLQGHGREVVAVKCIERRRLTKVSMENLMTEIKVMMDLDHQHIVKLKDFEVRQAQSHKHLSSRPTFCHSQC